MDWKTLLAGGLGGFLTGFAFPYLLWWAKRFTKGDKATEQLDRDSRLLDNLDRYFNLVATAEERGEHVAPPDSIAGMVRDDYAAVKNAAIGAICWALREAYTTSLLLERYPDDDRLPFVRTHYVAAFAETEKFAKQAIDMRPELARKAMYAYYYWIQNPTNVNYDAWQSALADLSLAIETGEVQVSED